MTNTIKAVLNAKIIETIAIRIIVSTVLFFGAIGAFGYLSEFAKGL